MWNRNLSKKNKVSFVIGIVSLFLAGAILPSHFSVTLSPSLDYRVFYLDKRINLVDKGSYVLFMKSHNLIDNGEKFHVIKKIICAQGDVFKNKGRDYYCNGMYLGTAKNKSLKGEPLINFVYSGEIPEGHYAVWSNHKDSFDTRYFGFIKKDEIKALARPLW
jgi:conjugal transfer pilin signal peptidase TrbI